FEGVPLYSLYGTTESSLRSTAEQFEGLDVLVVDLQDVGARYYTYAATMGYALETAAQVGLPPEKGPPR
ncbi:MAG: exo-beta-N-acetylmuramidase NamZ domain-containing protein, partial [Myxococcota bacterium]